MPTLTCPNAEDSAVHNLALHSRNKSDNERNSSSKPSSTFQASEGCAGSHSADMTDDSVCAKHHVGPSPFTAFGSQGHSFRPSTPSKSKLNVRFADTHQDSGCDDNLLSDQPPSRCNALERTASRLMAEIADEVSRNSQSVGSHARRSSADSQDTSRDHHSRSRKRNRCHLLKAASAPDNFGTELPAIPWVTDAQNWASYTYHQTEPGSSSERKAGRAETGPAKGRTPNRKRYTGRHRTSRFIGVGSSNRKTQWQARILVQGKVTHLGYYSSEMEAASIYDRIALSLNPAAQTNFPASSYPDCGLAEFSGLGREDLQRALGVKPMDKSSKFRGVSRKKGKWEAKVMVNRKWAYRALFDSEAEAAHAYDAAVWRLKPNEATSFINFKDGVSTRDTPAKSPKRELQRAVSTPAPRPVIKVEESLEPSPEESELKSPSVTLEDEHLFACVDSADEQSIPRSQTVPLPMGTLGLPKTGSSHQLAPPPTLHHAASLPAMHGAGGPWVQMGMTSQGLASQSSMVCPSPARHSPQPSMCTSEHMPPVLPVAVPVLPHMELPDPNSIGVPPPLNLPFPELVPGGVPTSVTSTPRHRPESPFPGGAQLSPSHTSSPRGLPPLPRSNSVLEQEAPLNLFTDPMSQLSTAQTYSSCVDLHTDLSTTANPFYHASLPRVSTQPDLRGLAHVQPLSSFRSQPGLVSPAETSAHCGPGQAGLSANGRKMSYSASMPEILVPIGLPHLSTHPSIESIQSAHYVPSPAGLTQPMGDMYSGVALPQVDSPMSLETARNMTNSRSASSNNFLHSAASSSRMPASSANSGLHMFPGTDMSSLRHDSAHAMSKLHHAIPLEANFFSQGGDLIHTKSSGSNQSCLHDARRLNSEQADLLANLDVDVEMNEPVPLNPVHIGGEDMNVYSPHIMGDCEVSTYM